MYANKFVKQINLLKILFRFTERFDIPSGDYLFFKASTLCMSPVGKKAGENEQSLRVGGCKSKGQVEHEIMHNLGNSKFYFHCR